MCETMEVNGASSRGGDGNNNNSCDGGDRNRREKPADRSGMGGPGRDPRPGGDVAVNGSTESRVMITKVWQLMASCSS